MVDKYDFCMYSTNMTRKRATGQRKGSDKLKSTKLLVRLHPDEKQAFAVAADLAGIAVSAWVRERLRWAAIKELQAADRQVPFLAESLPDQEVPSDVSKG